MIEQKYPVGYTDERNSLMILMMSVVNSETLTLQGNTDYVYPQIIFLYMLAENRACDVKMNRQMSVRSKL